jgi:recombination protein RecR
MQYPKSFQRLINEFAALPSIGPKAAERMVLYLFKQDKERLSLFAESLESLQALRQCSECFNLSEDTLCTICRSEDRERKILCVVEEPLDAFAFERLGTFTGRYHILGGVIQGGKKSNEAELRITELLDRVEKDTVEEIILATNPTTEGDLTALYLKQKLSIFQVRITRIAKGLSTGGDIEYADEATLRSSLNNREVF